MLIPLRKKYTLRRSFRCGKYRGRQATRGAGGRARCCNEGCGRRTTIWSLLHEHWLKIQKKTDK